MTGRVKLDDRTPEYWVKLRDYVEVLVAKFSEEMELAAKWDGEKPWIRLAFNWSEETIAASIRRDGDQAEITFTLGILVWLDDAARWMNEDVPFRSQLRVANRYPEADHSTWLIFRWIEWIFRHEIAHFLCGHLSTPVSHWTEGEKVRSRSVSLATAMEADADIYAAHMYFEFLHRCVEKKIYDDFYASEDPTPVFWDLGMMFGGLFVAFEHLTPHGEVRLHPKATDRLMIFLTEGLATYSALAVRPCAPENSAMLSGLAMSLFLLGKDGKNLMQLAKRPLKEANEWKRLLLAAGVHERRLISPRNDWLRRPLQARSLPAMRKPAR